MRKTLKILSIINIVIGGFAFFGLVEEFDPAVFIGAIWLIANGILVLVYISNVVSDFTK